MILEISHEPSGWKATKTKFEIMAYSVMVNTHDFDSCSPGSNPGKPTNNCKYRKPIPTLDQ